MPKPINSLCSIEDLQGPLKFHCFKKAEPLVDILDNFFYLSRKFHSDLFQRIWKSKLKDISNTKDVITFSSVVTDIWNPVFDKCCQLIDSIKTRSIILRDVDLHFRQLHDEGSVCEHLRNLYMAIETCNSRKVGQSNWIQVSVDLMEQYWSLCEQGKAARIVLELKEKLKLTGNFEIIEYVANQVTTSMKSAPLEKIDQKLIQAKSFLEQFTSEQMKLDCLEKFAACLNIVGWIRKETRGKPCYVYL